MELSAATRRLRVALGFLQLSPSASELRLLHRWLDSWRGVGVVAVGMHRQGWDLQLTEYGDEHWRGDVLRDRHGALHRRRVGVGTDGVARGAAGGVGDFHGTSNT